MLYMHLQLLTNQSFNHVSYVTGAHTEEIEANYRDSNSEKKDMKDLYTKYKGTMSRR